MDEDQFYAECDDASGAFFRNLLAHWTKAGGALKWGAGGVGLRGVLRGQGADGKEVGVCFLAPQFAGKKDRIELACTTLAKQIGHAATEKLHAALRQAAGASVAGKTMVSVIQPGLLPASAQKSLTKVFVDLL